MNLEKIPSENKWIFGWAPTNTKGFFQFGMAQTLTAPLALNMHIHRHPKINNIIEFGTGCGALTLLFGMAMIQRKGNVYTFDLNKPWESWHKAKQGLPVHYTQLDIFEHEKQIKDLLQEGKQTLLFCDNGNKPKEVNVFSKYLKKGDLIIAHDWNQEIKHENIKNLIDTGILKYYNQKFFDDNNTMMVSLKRL